MSVPILLLTGFLGAGKTTLVNHILHEPHGRRLAVIVNDFGAIDIDAQLLEGMAGGVASLKNGCICCSLQGDLLQTLSRLLQREPPPDGILIETSGVSDPAEIIRALLDPLIWKAAALDAVICVADAREIADRPSMLEDPLCRSQLNSSDFIALTKSDLVNEGELVEVRTRLQRLKPDRVINDATFGRLAPELLFSAQLHQPVAAVQRRYAVDTAAFQSVSWTSAFPLIADRFQVVINRLAGKLVRAKGLICFTHQKSSPMLFQLVGTRATIGPAPSNSSPGGGAKLVFIARDGALDESELVEHLASCVDPSIAAPQGRK